MPLATFVHKQPASLSTSIIYSTAYAFHEIQATILWSKAKQKVWKGTTASQK